MAKKSRNQIRKKLIALFAAAAVTASCSGMTVFADTHTLATDNTVSCSDISSIGITKKITTDGYTFAPNTTFYFTVENGSDSDSVSLGSDSDPLEHVKAGVTGGLATTASSDAPSGSGSAISFSPGSAQDVASSYTGSSQLTIDPTVFTETGIYVYTVTEYQPTGSDAYEGILYDDTEYNVYLFVYQDSDNTYFVGNVIVTKSIYTTADSDDSDDTAVKTGEEKVGSTGSDESDTNGDGNSDSLSDDTILFTNNYGMDGSTPGTDDNGGDDDEIDIDETANTIHYVTVTKSVTGNLGDAEKAFAFTVSVAGAYGEKFKVEYASSDDAETSVDYLVSSTDNTDEDAQTSLTISLKDTGYIRIYGLSESDQVTVSEKDYSGDGYTATTAETTSGYITEDSDYTVEEGQGTGTSFTVAEDAAAITVTNDKSVTTPTGLFLNFAPFAVMILAAAASAIVLLRRKSITG